MAEGCKINRCCNPFNKKNHLKREKLRPPSLSLIQKAPTLLKEYLICDACRKQIGTMGIPESDARPGGSQMARGLTSSSMDSFETQVSDVSIATKLPVINHALQLLGNSPISRKRLSDTASTSNQIACKVSKVTNNIKNDLGIKTCKTDEIVNDFSSIINSLKAKYHAPYTTFVHKVEILTVLPNSWSITKMVGTIKCSYHAAKVAKNVAATRGILSKPDKNMGRPISQETKNSVISFYTSDEISTIMPGKKDFISIKNDSGQRIHHQKRLVMGNLKEIYHQFKEVHPGVAIGFSSFANLRPLFCVLAGSSGTHTVCVCSIHQNFKLMMLASNLKSLTTGHEFELSTYEDVLMLLICADFTPDCYLGSCDNCPGVENLHAKILRILTENNVENITYKCWVSKPRCTLETMNCSMAVFVDKFCEQAQVLLPHSFIAKNQSSYLRFVKENLSENDCIVICDFAENYAFVVQNAAPGFHFNNNQATVYPVVLYYKKNAVLEHRSLCIISDCLHHDAITVYAFSTIVNDFVKTFIPNPTKLIYFSDGAPQQFKNFKNFCHIYHHEEDFGVPAEWNFFATAHGKGPCDGIGGTIKRLAARASLQLPVERQILTPKDLYEWASRPESVPSVTVKYWEGKNYERIEEFLSRRFQNTKTVPQTLKVHSVLPDAAKKLKVKRYSLAETSKVVTILKN